jgi:hypothetical protein
VLHEEGDAYTLYADAFQEEKLQWFRGSPRIPESTVSAEHRPAAHQHQRGLALFFYDTTIHPNLPKEENVRHILESLVVLDPDYIVTLGSQCRNHLIDSRTMPADAQDEHRAAGAAPLGRTDQFRYGRLSSLDIAGRTRYLYPLQLSNAIPPEDQRTEQIAAARVQMQRFLQQLSRTAIKPYAPTASP